MMFRKRVQDVVPTFRILPDWYLAFGSGLGGHEYAGATWRDDNIAIFRAQPAFSSDHRYAVIADARLSNRSTLLDQLETAANPSFTDTQLIAALWERFGASSVERLEGMFGFAVYDRQMRALWLARDRVGARTLYYTQVGTPRLVAPRLATIARRGFSVLDWVALRDYLSCAFVPGERTLLKEVREVRPGALVTLPDNQTRFYWQVQEQITDPAAPLAEYAKRLRSLLEEVVQASLPTDAPVGAYLSGGLDSSLVVALAAKFHRHPVHTYSIHFGDECPNELEFSSLVANHTRTRHHIIKITAAEMWQLLPETMAHLDDPIGDPLTVPNLILGREARASVGVILNGEGGDPCFGGPKNQPMLLNRLYAATPEGETSGTIPTPDAVSAYLASFQKCALDLPQLLQPDVWQATKDVPSVFAADLMSGASYLNRLMFLNIKFKGADHILTKVNNLTRATGLIGLSPLFDERIVAMSLQIPPSYKLSGAAEKAVLKEAVKDLLPDAIIARPKSGMMVPVQLRFRKYWQREARALLLNKRARLKPYLNQKLIGDWLAYRGDTWSRYGVKLWLLVSLEYWLQANTKP